MPVDAGDERGGHVHGRQHRKHVEPTVRRFLEAVQLVLPEIAKAVFHLDQQPAAAIHVGDEVTDQLSRAVGCRHVRVMPLHLDDA